MTDNIAANNIIQLVSFLMVSFCHHSVCIQLHKCMSIEIYVTYENISDNTGHYAKEKHWTS